MSVPLQVKNSSAQLATKSADEVYASNLIVESAFDTFLRRDTEDVQS